MSISITVKGLDELQKKLDGKFLIQPEIETALDTVTQRALRPTKGLGFKMNPLTVRTPLPLNRVIITPLAIARSTKPAPAHVQQFKRQGTPRPHWMYWAIFNPRMKGTSWLKSMIGSPGYGVGALGAVAKNAVQSAARKIAARWAE